MSTCNHSGCFAALRSPSPGSPSCRCACTRLAGVGRAPHTWKMACTSSANSKRPVAGVWPPPPLSRAPAGVASAARPCGAAGFCSCSATAPHGRPGGHNVEKDAGQVAQRCGPCMPAGSTRRARLPCTLPSMCGLLGSLALSLLLTLVQLLSQLHASGGRSAAAAASRLRRACRGSNSRAVKQRTHKTPMVGMQHNPQASDRPQRLHTCCPAAQAPAEALQVDRGRSWVAGGASIHGIVADRASRQAAARRDGQGQHAGQQQQARLCACVT